MAKPIVLNDTLRAEYLHLFYSCQINPERYKEIDRYAQTIISNKARYEAVVKGTKTPWYFVGLVHLMEAGFKFDRHLHNGDPLRARTVNVPAGRPKTGNAPFTWEHSANDALTMTGVLSVADWQLSSLLYQIEAYNGFGYRRRSPQINSPYLWSYSNNYTKGKYVKDGVFDPEAVSKQPGAVTVLKRLVELGAVSFPSPTALERLVYLGTIVPYAPNKVNEKGRELQKVLNLLGETLREDGKIGPKSAQAYTARTGDYLAGDPAKP